MRLSLFVLATTTAVPAFAQGSVTLTGIVDLAARSVSNEGVGSMQSLVSGSNATSRIALSGREDLGGGLAAGFHLEHGLAADTGAAASAGKFWDRRSTVSLMDRRWGELRLGRDFVPSYSAWSRHDPFAYVGVARSANLVSASPTGPIRSAFGSNANTTVRADNALQWLLPAWRPGLEGAVMLAAGEGGAAASGQAKVIGLRLGYTAAGFGFTAATTRSENSLTGGAKFTDTVLGAQGEWAPVKLSAAWRRFEQADATQTLTLLAASTTFGAHEFKGSWIRSDLAGSVGATAIGANDAHQLGLGYVHHLSRRSALYASWARISNDGAARFVIPDGAAGLVAGGRSSGYEAGFRHRF